MKYFKIKTGYNRDEFLSIPETELAKAIYSHIHGTVFVHSMGTLSGKLIQRIDPDYHRELQLNFDHELRAEDMRRLPSQYKHQALQIIEQATSKVLSADNREHLFKLSDGRISS